MYRSTYRNNYGIDGIRWTSLNRISKQKPSQKGERDIFGNTYGNNYENTYGNAY